MAANMKIAVLLMTLLLVRLGETSQALSNAEWTYGSARKNKQLAHKTKLYLSSFL